MRKTAAVLGLLAVTLGGCGRNNDPAPNLLIVTLDTTRADRFGFAGYDDALTPQFDAFVAERAVSFSNAITAVPVTFPSHTSIMTGTYPVFHGVHDNDGYYLDNHVTTLAEILKSEGFTTGIDLSLCPVRLVVVIIGVESLIDHTGCDPGLQFVPPFPGPWCSGVPLA